MTLRRFDLFERMPFLKRILKSRVSQPAMMLFTLFFFVLAILAGIFGTPAGSKNFAIIFIWIVWWALLIIVLIPFGGRIWCAVCPIPAPGEWLQRKGIIIRRPGELRSLHWRWPRLLKNIWLQNFGFLAVAIFSAMILTRPLVTAWVLLGFMLLAVVLSSLFEKRIFCRYVCPVGGFIGLYSLFSSIELRVTDPKICRRHTTKDCFGGNGTSYGCPWLNFPGGLERNAYCGLCFECLRACPENNISLNLRPFGRDLSVARGKSLDEAYKAFIMLSSALLYSIVLLGPWGWLKSWANMASPGKWLLYAFTFLAINLLLVPGLFFFITFIARYLSRVQASMRQVFIDYAYALVPMGLSGWIAFSLSFVFVNGSYALSVISDPFGWGWNILGTANVEWSPFWPQLVSFLQMGTLVTGLIFSMIITFRLARLQTGDHQLALRGALPVSTFLLVLTLGFLKLYVG